MLLSETVYKVDVWVSLGVIGLILAASVVASLIATRGAPARTPTGRAHDPVRP
jgi:hypothetical protein